MNKPHHNSHDASHPQWGFRAASAIWFGTEAIEPNMMAFAHELSRWLRRESHQFVVFHHDAKDSPGAPTNPYTYHAATHFGLIASTISAATDFVESTEDLLGVEAEARRLRLYNELVLESARFCEASIKQTLYCTSIEESLCKNWSLGQLMAADCKPCRKAGTPHHYSLLGALACQYYQARSLRRAVSTTSPSSTAGATPRLRMHHRPG